MGDYQLRVLTPTLLEVTLVNTGTRAGDPTSITNWNFVNNNAFTAPAVSDLVVTVNGAADAVQSVGFKRRPLYAPLNEYDLRLGNYLYLQLAAAIPDNATVQVSNPRANLWPASAQFQTTTGPIAHQPGDSRQPGRVHAGLRQARGSRILRGQRG